MLSYGVLGCCYLILMVLLDSVNASEQLYERTQKALTDIRYFDRVQERGYDSPVLTIRNVQLT